MVGADAQLADGIGEDRAASGVVLGRDGAGPHQHDVRAQLEGHRERGLGAPEPVVELLGRVERPARRQRDGDERQLDRPEDVPELAPARLAEAVGGQVADGVNDDALAPMRAAS